MNKSSKPVRGSLNLKFILSMISHTIVCLAAQYVFFFYIFNSITSKIKIDSINTHNNSNIVNSVSIILNQVCFYTEFFPEYHFIIRT